MILCGFAYSVEIPDSLLTDAQKQLVEQKSTQENVKGWIGIGSEIGKAVDASMQAITSRTNEFANTPMGKLTVVLVVWKVMGGTLVALFSIILFTVMFGGWGFYIYKMHKSSENSSTDRDAWSVCAFLSGVVYFITIIVCVLNIV